MHTISRLDKEAQRIPLLPPRFGSGFVGAHSSDRRLRQRYTIALDIVYKILDGSDTSFRGFGRTVNISSSGVLVQIQDRVTTKHLELSIQWPCLLEGLVPLRLVVRGDIVRNENNFVAVEIKWHEFRTAGSVKVQGAA